MCVWIDGYGWMHVCVHVFNIYTSYACVYVWVDLCMHVWIKYAYMDLYVCVDGWVWMNACMWYIWICGKYACMNEYCMYIDMCMDGWMYAWMYLVSMHVYVCVVYAWMYICINKCMCVWMHVCGI